MNEPDVVLVPRAGSGGGSGRRMHVPDPDDPDDSLCRYSGEYRRRSLAGARDHFEWCDRCRVKSTEGAK